MKKKMFIFCTLLLAAGYAMAQTDTTAKLQDAHIQWVQYNSSGDTTVFAQIQSDYSGILVSDSTNAAANKGMGDVYNSLADYWMNLAMPLETTNLSLYTTYINRSNSYHALASPYLDRYLRKAGISH
jgi:hypothetical protein